ncbi:hypothetical protein GU243_21915 [Pseudarthrobacter psychrotolerans]|uniref:Uncharacterized protein n=1 Tax=Pseudarthrobacter psychrotolerans TaxID=2697569 RepID=A0A6P1NU13_9MICC|nr:hypothetical protein [Pseudarthrobacter psychrotolerans]QHK21880.1 hypothetical protein GU243_21915 [Pseudarthrobacter psychrotolerans]
MRNPLRAHEWLNLPTARYLARPLNLEVGNTAATSNPSVNATTGAWSMTLGQLGAQEALYSRATPTDFTGNIGNNAVARPISVL